jgi:hypothetical protein
MVGGFGLVVNGVLLEGLLGTGAPLPAAGGGGMEEVKWSRGETAGSWEGTRAGGDAPLLGGGSERRAGDTNRNPWRQAW